MLFGFMWLRSGIWLAAVVTAGAASTAFGVPLGWLLGPLVAAMAMRPFMEPPRSWNRHGQVVGQWMVGAVTGSVFSLQALAAGVPYAPALVLLTGLTFLFCIVNGVLLKRFAGVDSATGFLGSLPGGAAAMSAMAIDLKADQLTVTLLLYVRVVLVVTLVPLILSAGMGLDPTMDTVQTGADTSPWSPLIVGATLAVAVAGAWAGRRIGLPTANFLGAFLMVAVANGVFPEIELGLPDFLFATGLLLIGASIGSQCDPRQLRVLGRPALIQAILVVVLIALCMATGVLFHHLTGVDALTAILGMTPGGFEAMVALAMTMEGNVELVVVMQTLRWMLVLFLGPILVTRISRSRA